MVNDVIADFENRMKKASEALRQHLASIRTGRASTALVEHIHVEAYGAAMPLNQLASITVPEARMLIIQPFDSSMIKAIGKAIQSSDLGLTPNDDGRIIRLVIPSLTEERRREMVKLVRSRVEEARISVRNQRREAMDDLKQLEAEKLIGSDDQHRGQERIQQITDKAIKDLDQIGSDKEAEVMEV